MIRFLFLLLLPLAATLSVYNQPQNFVSVGNSGLEIDTTICHLRLSPDLARLVWTEGVEESVRELDAKLHLILLFLPEEDSKANKVIISDEGHGLSWESVNNEHSRANAALYSDEFDYGMLLNPRYMPIAIIDVHYNRVWMRKKGFETQFPSLWEYSPVDTEFRVRYLSTVDRASGHRPSDGPEQ